MLPQTKCISLLHHILYSLERILYFSIVMLKSLLRTNVRYLSQDIALRSAYSLPRTPRPVATEVVDLKLLKFDSIGQEYLYAICRINNIPFLVTRGDRIILPYKIKNHEVGDVLNLNNVTTIGSRNFTFNREEGIPKSAYRLTATLAEITREPKYYVYKKKPRCRRLKTVEVEPFQTHLVIDQFKLT